ncbi:Receptor-like protein kinase HSL1, partial [Linum perenne]
LSVLNYLDLSGNNLDGEIPGTLQNLKLNQLNLSNNKISGEIPPLYAKENYKNSFLGNPELCGDIPGLCGGGRGRNGGQDYVLLLRSMFILAVVVFVVGVVWFYVKYRNIDENTKAAVSGDAVRRRRGGGAAARRRRRPW